MTRSGSAGKPMTLRRGRRRVVMGIVGGLATGTFVFAAAGTAHADTQTFTTPATGQSFQVPAGVTSLDVDVVGANGGKGSGAGVGGLAGQVIAAIPVTPCETLTVGVGGIDGPAGVSAGAGGVNGGGAGAHPRSRSTFC